MTNCATPGCTRTNIVAHGLCRLCYNREWKQNNPGRMAQYSRDQRARNVEAAREAGRRQYAARAKEIAARKQKWAATNREKVNASTKAWREANPEKWKAIKQNGQSRRRARKQSASKTFTMADWRVALEQTNHSCFYCGAKNLPLQQEHMTPLSRGGAHVVGNVVPACGPCNWSKGSLTAEEFKKRLKA